MSDTLISNPGLTVSGRSMESLQMSWQADHTLINLRGNPQDDAFRRAIAFALGCELPAGGGGMAQALSGRLIELGPDDWFLLSPAGQAERLTSSLRQALDGVHAAVTDVSSGYLLLRLSGRAASEVLAQGCPLDLHPRTLLAGRCMGSHFFKASIWLWRSPSEHEFEILVRRSFKDYVALMMERAAMTCAV